MKYSLFCDGLDEEICNRSGLYLLKGTHNISDEFDKLQATLRAIVLFYWTKGYSIEELKKKTGFHQFTKIIAGDIERLAEMVAFHLDAIQRCLTTANDPISGKSVLENAAAVRAFYELHTRVKYGMPRELAKFANKHVHGLDRKRLLKLKQCADEAKLSPIQYLCITPSGRIPTDVLTATQHTQLLMAMERRGNVRHIDTLMEIIQNDLATDLNDEQFDSLKEIANWGDLTQSDRVDAETLFTNLRNVIENNSAFESVDFSTDGDYNRILWTIRDLKTNKRRRVYFGILAEDETDESLVSFFEKAKKDPNAYAKILVAPYKFSTEQVDRAMKAHKVHTLIDNMYLTFVLSNTIRMHIDEGHALTEMLADLRGSFTAADYRYFPLLNFLYREKDNTVPRYRILFGGGNSLRADGGFNAQESARNLTARENFGPCEILPWGDQLVDDTYNFAECPTIISLTRKDVTRSESLTRFIYKMQNQHFRHCLLLLDSEEAEIAWNSPEVMEEYGSTQWSPQFNSITKDIVYDERSAQTRIRNFVDTWRPGKYLVGISYAHYTSVQGDPSSELKTDCDRIFELAEALKKEFGEDHIFFDRFSPAKEVFEENRNAEKSIKAYETCLANIILWNYWTKNNENCIREREAILKRSASDEAYCMFVKTGNPTDPESYENYFPLLLRNESDIEKIVSRIKQEVEARLNNE